MGKVNITPIERRGFACQNGNRPLSANISAEDRVRFWAKVCKRNADECWPWQGSGLGREGYGQFTVTSTGGASRKQLHLYAHRVAWIVTRGDIPQGVSVLHRCDNPGCVNPDHLFLGSQLDNMRDASQKGRLSIARRRNRRGVKPVAVARYLNGGVSADALAAEFGVCKLTILRWVHESVGDVDLRLARRQQKEGAA